MIKIILASLVMVGCAEKSVQAGSQYSWDCHSVDIITSRCENREVICYTRSGGLSCFWKGEK